MIINFRSALDTITVFGSVGTTNYDVTFTNLDGQQQGFIRGIPAGRLSAQIMDILRARAVQKHNVIIRPRAAGIVFHQLDDLDVQGVERVRPVTLLAIENSWGSFQAWLATRDAGDDNQAKKAFRQRLCKALGYDGTASGATRIPGSFNYQPHFEPGYPRVLITYSNSGRIVTPAELEQLGLVAPAENTETKAAACPPPKL
jgi:hypothetical protein